MALKDPKPGRSLASFRGDPMQVPLPDGRTVQPVAVVALSVPTAEAPTWRFATPPAILEALGLLEATGRLAALNLPATAAPAWEDPASEPMECPTCRQSVPLRIVRYAPADGHRTAFLAAHDDDTGYPCLSSGAFSHEMPGGA